jgi:ubiquinone/menaquinone biosynthesis C-methylase UbiE
MELPETERLRAVYGKREGTKKHLYNPLDIGAFYLQTSRDKALTQMLRTFLRHSGCSLSELHILEVGCGTGGVLRSLISWGAQPKNLAGVDVLEERIRLARQLSPNICFLVADAQRLPFMNESWDMVLLFTVISSVPDRSIQSQIASEVLRVLKPRGAILWYDFWLNPLNSDTVGITRSRVQELFPGCRPMLKRVTLAPPLARRVARVSQHPFSPTGRNGYQSRRAARTRSAPVGRSRHSRVARTCA